MSVLIDKIKKLGYSVEVVMELDKITVYRVEGFGISIMVNSDDRAALNSIVKAANHKERVKQHKQGGL